MTFCVVADAGNVTQAAERLCRTQSAISVQIRKLEESLGVALFVRQARGVELSDEGRRLYPLAMAVLTEVDKIGRLFEAPLSGKIRVGIPDDYNDSLLETALAEFGRRHEQVEVFVQSGCTQQYPDQIASGQLDLAVYSAGPVSKRESIYSEPVHWVASRDFRFNHTDTLPVAIFDRHCWWRDRATKILDRKGIQWRAAYVSANFASIKTAVRTGLAIGVLAKSAMEPSFRVLGEQEGLPALFDARLKLLKRRASGNPLIPAMETTLRDAFAGMTPASVGD